MMENHDAQFCPVAQAAEVIAQRWTPLILREMLCGSHRFTELQQGIPLISPSLLTRRLRTLEDAGILEKHRAEHDGRVQEYHLTEAGEELRPVIMQLGAWGIRWLQRKVELHAEDAAVLMWDIRRNIVTDELPDRRVVIHFELRGVPDDTRLWWLVVDPEESVDLCLKPPGHDVDVNLVTTLSTMVSVWLGDVSVEDAIDDGELRLGGDDELSDTLARWLGLSPFAEVPR
jgi:DNA-binding HxlR family transcriptional regulator